MLDKNAIVRIVSCSKSSKIGTGFLFGEKYILTCNHVVSDCSQIQIQFTGIDGSKNAPLQVKKVIGEKEDCLDYAVLEIAEESLSLKPSKASCLCLANTEQMELREGLYVQLAGHIKTDDLGNSFSPTSEREVKLGPAINNGFLLWQESSNLYVMQDGFSGSPVLDIQTGKILGILNYTDADKYTDKTGGATGKMIRSDAIKRSLKEYDTLKKTNYCDLLFTPEDSPNHSYIEDGYTHNIKTLAAKLSTAILFIGPGINLYNRNDNLDKRELERICDFNNQSNRSLSEIEFAYFLDQQIKKEKPEIKCLQAEIPELKIQFCTDQHIPCPSCPYELSERPENCWFRLENNSQDQTNNQPSIEERLMNAQFNVQFLSQYYSKSYDGIGNIIEEIRNFYAQSQPNDAHKLIAKYVKNAKIKLIITTNCDDLLERAFCSSPADIQDYGVYSLQNGFTGNKPLVCLHLRQSRSPDAPIILKLHGCYKSHEGHNLLIAKSDFSTYYSMLFYHHFDNIKGQLLELNDLNKIDLNWENIWFIGCTLNDLDINLLINIFKSGLWEKQKNEFYWVYDQSLSLNKTNRLWNEDEHLKLVPRTLESFFNDLEHFYGLLN